MDGVGGVGLRWGCAYCLATPQSKIICGRQGFCTDSGQMNGVELSGCFWLVMAHLDGVIWLIWKKDENQFENSCCESKTNHLTVCITFSPQPFSPSQVSAVVLGFKSQFFKKVEAEQRDALGRHISHPSHHHCSSIKLFPQVNVCSTILNNACG